MDREEMQDIVNQIEALICQLPEGSGARKAFTGATWDAAYNIKNDTHLCMNNRLKKYQELMTRIQVNTHTAGNLLEHLKLTVGVLPMSELQQAQDCLTEVERLCGGSKFV